MAAYAAVVSLTNTINNIQIHPRLSTSFNKNHLKSLGDAAGFLLDFIESYNCRGRSKEVEDLEAEIACAAHAAEDLIESHIVDKILAGSAKKNLEDQIASAAHAVGDVIKSKIVNQIQGGCTQYDLEDEIASAAHAAEDVIESNMLEQILAMIKRLKKLPLPRVMCDLQKVTKDMDSIKVCIMGRFQDQQPPPPSADSSRPVIAGKTNVVGFEEHTIQLMDKLTCTQSHLQAIPIIGMGGVGKTTLARNAFDSSLIKHHFDIRAWATISQDYSVRGILLQLLSIQDNEGSKKISNMNEQELGEELHKVLFNRRYLIVLDDMWGVEVWEEIKFFFPDNGNGSSIVVTTRLLEIALHFNSSYLTVNLLDEEKSWNLFCQESCGEEGCPAELEEVGKKICENCKGLPLSIVVIGGFLKKSSKAVEYWEGVARDTYSILSSEGDKQCMDILSLSYNHLPAHLKPCFLYMGIFAEDKRIPVSELIKLWVAEGILRPNDGQSLEEVGEGYLKDLVDRNLILVSRWGSSGKIRFCNIHDLIRELCLSIAEKEEFLCVMKEAGALRARRLVFLESMSNPKVACASLVRSLICKGRRRHFNFSLLRILCVAENSPDVGFLDADLRSVNLRCLDHRYSGEREKWHPSVNIPKNISLLWNLQTVKIKGLHQQYIAPAEIWEMVQLRHLQVYNLYVPDPPQNDRVDIVLPNLQKLRDARNFQLSDEVCKRIPNIKKLHLGYRKSPRRYDAASYYCPQNLGRLHKLASLFLDFEYLNWRPMVVAMTFPSSLKKLTLRGGDLHWEDLEMIGSLPNLEVLKLWAFSIIGSEWSPVEGGFCSLKFLEIYCCTGLSKWNAEHFHFPVLEKLVLGLLSRLDEIPSGIGDIPTLRIITLYHCSLHCALSAVKVLEEQESLGNDDLQVEVEFHIHNNREPDIFRQMVEEEGFTSNNLHIKRVYK